MLISAMIAPAVLISAAGLLILGAVNRYGRILDRIRFLNAEMLDGDEAKRAALRLDRDMLAGRARRAWIALTLLHFAVLSFVVESLLLGINAATGWNWLQPAQDLVIVIGILLFGGASLQLASEARVAFETTRREIDRVDQVLDRGRC
jgi:hypothetical protein